MKHKIDLMCITYLEADMNETICSQIKRKAGCTEEHCDNCLFTVPDEELAEMQTKIDTLQLITG